MPKSNQPDKNSRSLSELPRLIQIDEGIFGGRLSERITPDFIEQNLDKFLQKLKDFKIIMEDKDFEEDDYEYEEFDPEEFEPKVYAILGNQNLEVNLRNQKKYLSYLKQAIQKPCLLTGNQEFAWEEYYIFGDGTQKQHEKQRKTKASFMDEFTLIGFSPNISKSDGIMVEVERVSDRKKFMLPLWQLEEVEPTTKNSELINNYVTWFEYYQD